MCVRKCQQKLISDDNINGDSTSSNSSSTTGVTLNLRVYSMGYERQKQLEWLLIWQHLTIVQQQTALKSFLNRNVYGVSMTIRVGQLFWNSAYDIYCTREALWPKNWNTKLNLIRKQIFAMNKDPVNLNRDALNIVLTTIWFYWKEYENYLNTNWGAWSLILRYSKAVQSAWRHHIACSNTMLGSSHTLRLSSKTELQLHSVCELPSIVLEHAIWCRKVD